MTAEFCKRRKLRLRIMTSPLDPEEDNSNLVSSSGSSPVLFTDPEAEVLQVLPSKATSEIRSKR